MGHPPMVALPARPPREFPSCRGGASQSLRAAGGTAWSDKSKLPSLLRKDAGPTQ